MPKMSAADDALISTFGRLVEAQSALGRHLGRSLEQECGLPHSSFEALLRISRSEGGQISMSALAQQVALTSGGITRLLDRLVAADYVTRVPCATDRRVQYATLTATGKRKLEQASGVHARNLRQVFESFSKDDLEIFDQLLDKLREFGFDDGDTNDEHSERRGGSVVARSGASDGVDKATGAFPANDEEQHVEPE